MVISDLEIEDRHRILGVRAGPIPLPRIGHEEEPEYRHFFHGDVPVLDRNQGTGDE